MQESIPHPPDEYRKLVGGTHGIDMFETVGRALVKRTQNLRMLMPAPTSSTPAAGAAAPRGI